MIVVDVNVIAYLYLPGDFRDLAKAVFLKDREWAVPYLWRSEFRSVLTGYFRKNLISADICKQLLAQAEEQMQGHEYLVPSEFVMQLVKTSDCSAYDCEYAALALQLNLPLITADKQILSAFPEHAMTMSDFVSV